MNNLIVYCSVCFETFDCFPFGVDSNYDSIVQCPHCSTYINI